MILQLIWLAAIAHLRSPAGRKRSHADQTARWGEVHELTTVIGCPSMPIGLRGGR